MIFETPKNCVWFNVQRWIHLSDSSLQLYPSLALPSFQDPEAEKPIQKTHFCFIHTRGGEEPSVQRNINRRQGDECTSNNVTSVRKIFSLISTNLARFEFIVLAFQIRALRNNYI